MKIIVTILNDSKTLSFEIDENELIESISLLLNRELKTSNVEYDFIFNKTILETEQTLAQLNLHENCKIYAIKRKDKNLKRHASTEPVIDIPSFDLKKKCVIRNEKCFEHMIWNNKSLSEIQRELSETVKADPSLLESLILHPSTKEMIDNPSLVAELFSANPSISQLIKTEQDRVKFITDTSQYAWVRDIMAAPDQLERTMANYGDHVQHALSSTRYRRMLDTLDKTNRVTAESVVVATEPVDELEDFADDTLEAITKSSASTQIIDLMRDNNHATGLVESVLQSCPYGRALSAGGLNAIRAVLPASMDRLKEAIALSSEPANVVEYLRSNPIEVEPDLAAVLEEATSQLEGDNEPVRPCVTTLVRELHRRQRQGASEPTSTTITTGDGDRDHEQPTTTEQATGKFNREMALLAEIGFVDTMANVAALQSSYGNIDRAVAQLLSA